MYSQTYINHGFLSSHLYLNDLLQPLLYTGKFTECTIRFVGFSLASGKNFIKITSVGMGAAKTTETRYIEMVMSVNSGT